MGELRIDTATVSNLDGNVDDITIDSKNTDGVNDSGETEWMNGNWSQYWGYFNEVPDLKSALLMKAMWNTGNGFTTDDATQTVLDHIRGWGKDTFEDIIFNSSVISFVGGESFAQVIRGKDGTLINLKPLDPGSMVTVVGTDGMIIRYEQVSKIKEGKRKKFKPEEIFHLVNNRLADQIHGISDIESLEETILAENETFADMNWLAHRQARPMLMFKLGTDDQVKINEFVSKMDKATNKGENIYIPDDDNAVSWEVVEVKMGQVMLEWRNDIRNRFYRSVGLPQIVPGAGGQSTESESKAILAAFEVLVEMRQKNLERQLWEQLAVKLDFNPPGMMGDNLKQDEAKDAGQQLNTQPSDTQVGVGR